MQYFIFLLDEDSICAEHHGNVKIIGSAKKRSMIFLEYSRVFITLVRTGSAAGVNGHTIFVLKGQWRNGIFTDEFLQAKGCVLG